MSENYKGYVICDQGDTNWGNTEVVFHKQLIDTVAGNSSAITANAAQEVADVAAINSTLGSHASSISTLNTTVSANAAQEVADVTPLKRQYKSVSTVSAISTANPSPVLGDKAYCQDSTGTYVWNGSAWVVDSIESKTTFAAVNPSSVATSVLPSDLQVIDRGGVSMVVKNGSLGKFTFSGVASYLYVQAAMSLGGSISGKTILNRFPAPINFNGFRLSIPSGDSAVVTYTYAISTNPLDNGSGLTWTPVTFSSATTITRSGASVIVSDLLSCVKSSSVDLFLFVRAYSPTAGYKYQDMGGQIFASQDNANFGNFGNAWASVSGDITSSGTLAPTTSDWSECQVMGADFYGKQCFTIACIGDSLDQGWSVNSGSTEASYRQPTKFCAMNLNALGYRARIV